MAEAALSRGKAVPPSAIAVISAAQQQTDPVKPLEANLLSQLVEAHNTLAALIAPATPRTMLLLREEAGTGLPGTSWLGPVKLVRRLMIAAACSLLLFVGMSYSHYTNYSPGHHTSIASTDGPELLALVLQYLSAAGLGASFLCLYKANRYVTEGTFDPMFEGSYWIRFSLGLISGLMLAVLINEEVVHDSKILEPGVIRVLLAILGGFSAELFYTFLSRFVEAFKSLFQGSTDELVKAEAAKARVRLAALQVEGQMQVAAKLLKLQQDIGANGKPEEIQRQLADLLKQVLPSTASESANPGVK